MFELAADDKSAFFAPVAAVVKDREKNHGMDVAARVEHLTSDKLALWGWSPGNTLAPVEPDHPTFVKQLNDRAAAGAPCPAASK